jgi:hypothetical protein
MTFRACVEVCLEVRLRKVGNLVEPVLLIGHLAAVLGAFSLAHLQAIPSQQPLPIANMADILTQLQDAVDQVCASSKRSEVC